MKEKGYSLVEILMAFAILAIAILPIMSMYPTVFKMNQGATEIEEVSRIALTVVDYVKAKGYDNLLHVGNGTKEITFDIPVDSQIEKTYSLTSGGGGYTSSAFETDFNYKTGLFVLNSKGLSLSNIKVTVLLSKAKVQLDMDEDPTAEDWKDIYKDFIIGKVIIGWGEDTPGTNEPTNKKRQFTTQFIVTPIEG